MIPIDTMEQITTQRVDTFMGYAEILAGKISSNPHEQLHSSSSQSLVNVDEDAGTGSLKWLWWFVIVYMFYSQAMICDEYFVESIKVMVERFKIPEDVAGATLMALGCNGPELFTNLIAIFVTHSDLGVGTIVGSEIFNLLCIVGGQYNCYAR